MKKLAMVIATIVMLAVLIPAAAWAGERSDLLDDRELGEIVAIAKTAYPRGSKVDMVVSDDIFGVFATVEFFTGDGRQYLHLDIFPAQATAIIRRAGSEYIAEKAGDKIVEGIERVLNKSPRYALDIN